MTEKEKVAWEKKMSKYTITENDTEEAIKQKQELLKKDLNLIKDEWFERTKGHTNKMKTEERYQNQLKILDILLEEEYGNKSKEPK